MKLINKILSICASPFMLICVLFSGCFFNKGTAIENGVSVFMQDKDVKPDFDPAYKEYSEAALNSYYAVANNHIIDGEIDHENEEVIAAARDAAAKLYAYACYNERHLDKYCYFSDQDGDTDLADSGKGNATRQEYYLRINENEQQGGVRYFYTLKKVNESTGVINTFKKQFESARLRMTENTEILYRFEGDKDSIRYKDDGTTLECDWQTNSKAWGIPDPDGLKMRKEEFIAPDKIEEDIVEYSDYEKHHNHTIRANINILAENIVKYASIMHDDEDCYFIMMTIDTDVANADKASMNMLREGNGSDNCIWLKSESDDPDAVWFGEDTGLRIIFRLWPNGLFRSYTVIERWYGEIVLFTGTANSTMSVEYSYSDRDCDATAHLQMLQEAKAAQQS